MTHLLAWCVDIYLQKIFLQNIRESFPGTWCYTRLNLEQGNIKGEAKPPSAECFNEKTQEGIFATL